MNHATTKPSLFHYTWPIFVELMLQILIGNVDQMMIGYDKPNAVGAIGNANQIFTVLIILFSVVSLAMSILVTQYIGSKQTHKISVTYSLSLLVNGVIGVVLAFVLIASQQFIFQFMQIPPAILEDTTIYCTIVALGLPVQAVYTTYVTMFRTQGWMKETMWISVLINAINILGNYLLIFGIGPFPALHVAGVALSSITSRMIGLVILVLYFKKKSTIALTLPKKVDQPKQQLKKILAIGLPSGGENISYEMSQIVIMKFINSFGTSVINTKVYVSIFAMLSYVYGNAVSSAAQIIVGYLIGAQEYDDAHHEVMKTIKYSVLVGVIVSTGLYFCSDWIFSFFTNDPIVIQLGKQIMLIEIVLEAGRAVNMTMVRSLQAVGDIRFPVMLGIVSMWGIATLFSYIFGVVFGWGLIGVWIAMAMDEGIRAVLFIIRWYQGGWRQKQLID